MKIDEENIDLELDPSAIEKHIQEGVYSSEASFLVLLEILIDPNDFLNYEIDNEGHVSQLHIYEFGKFSINFFPVTICELKFLWDLTFQHQNIRNIPECIRKLINLERLSLSYNNLRDIPKAIQELRNLAYLDLSYNKILEIPTFVKNLPKLNQLYLADEELNVPYRNVFDCLDIADLKENLSLKALSELFMELEKKEQTEWENLNRKFNEQKEPLTIIYPPKEILNTLPNKSRNFEYIILWMLGNNFVCGWLDFKSDPLNISRATLSKYLSILTTNRYVCKVKKGYYMITISGRRRLIKIENSLKNKE